jgi:hypothetical protein
LNIASGRPLDGREELIYKMDDGYLAASERRTDRQAVWF